MNWTEDISTWHTLFELKEDSPSFGFKGTIFFVTDFAKDMSTGELKTVIANTAFNGMNLGKGISSYIVTDKLLEETFTPILKTFREHEKECYEEYWAKRNKGIQDEPSMLTTIIDKNGDSLNVKNRWAFQGEIFVLERVNEEYWFVPEGENKDNELEWIDSIISNQGILIKE